MDHGSYSRFLLPTWQCHVWKTGPARGFFLLKGGFPPTVASFGGQNLGYINKVDLIRIETKTPTKSRCNGQFSLNLKAQNSGSSQQ